jgi:hypothetical protein
MFIDVNVHPDFYEIINKDKAKEELRHNIIDIHHNGLASLNHIHNQMACANLDKMVLMANDCSSKDKVVLVSNEEIKTLIDSDPDKFYGFVSVDPFNKNCIEQLEFAFTDLKLNGLVLYPARAQFYPNDANLEKIYCLCEKYNKPIMFQSGLNWEPNALSKFSHPLYLEEVAIKHPKLRFCISGFAWPWVRETAMLLLKYPNIYADTSILFFDCAREFFIQTFTKDIPSTWIDRSLRHQVMFGSNNPRFEQIRMAKALADLGYRDSTIELIKGDNALDFLCL